MVSSTRLHRRIPDIVACVILQLTKCLNRGIVENPHSLLAVRTSERIEQFHHIIKGNVCTGCCCTIFCTAYGMEDTCRLALAVTNKECLFFLCTDTTGKFTGNVGRQVKYTVVQQFLRNLDCCSQLICGKRRKILSSSNASTSFLSNSSGTR